MKRMGNRIGLDRINRPGVRLLTLFEFGTAAFLISPTISKSGKPATWIGPFGREKGNAPSIAGPGVVKLKVNKPGAGTVTEIDLTNCEVTDLEPIIASLETKPYPAGVVVKLLGTNTPPTAPQIARIQALAGAGKYLVIFAAQLTHDITDYNT